MFIDRFFASFHSDFPELHLKLFLPPLHQHFILLSSSYRTPDYMKRICTVSCTDMKSLRRNECEDIHKNCPVWFDANECETNRSVKKYCPLSCGGCQENSNYASKKKSGTRDTINASNTMEEAESCGDDHENCSGWAVRVLISSFFFAFFTSMR